MNSRKGNCGTAGLGALLLASFISILLAGWGATMDAPSRMQRMYSREDNPGCVPYSVKPRKKGRWWGRDDRGARSRRYSTFGKRDSRPLTLDLPNVGLKDADEIRWPYGGEFEYEMTGPSTIFPEGITADYRFSYTYEADPVGGVLKETADMVMLTDFKTTTESTIEFDGEGKTRAVDTFISMTVSGEFSGGIDAMELRTRLENHGDTIDQIYFPMVWEDYNNEIPRRVVTTIDSPPDGFIYVSTSSSPGFLAFLLSRTDWENYNRPKAWSPEFIGETPYTLGFESFIRLTISRLETCRRDVRAWWEESRADFDGWRPDDTTSIVVIDFKRPDRGEEEEACYSWG